MAATYGRKDLYGGAMSVELPVELIDSSDIRQIPDHQEVFLSPTTLTSIIFEINAYVHPASPPTHQSPSPSTHTSVSQDGTTTTTTTSVTTTSSTVVSNGGSGASTTSTPPAAQQEDLDASAAKFHFTDVISPPDTLVATLPTPQPIKMLDPSLSQFPAYMLAGNINTIDSRDPQSGTAQARTAPPSFPTTGSSASHANAPLSTLTHQLQLLIRLRNHGTDLIVRVAIPLKEFANAAQRLGGSEGAAEEMISQELGWAREVVARVVGTLGVRDLGLFGS